MEKLDDLLTPAKLIARAWENFSRMTLPPNCSEVQREETRRAFYTGASVVFAIFRGITDGDGDGEELERAYIDRVDAISAELNEFIREMNVAVFSKLKSAGEG
jgi:hypothetical protein